MTFDLTAHHRERTRRPTPFQQRMERLGRRHARARCRQIVDAATPVHRCPYCGTNCAATQPACDNHLLLPAIENEHWNGPMAT